MKDNYETIKNEIGVLSSLQHPNIKFYTTYEDMKYFHIVTEYCVGGHLFEWIETKEIIESIDATNFRKMVSIITYLN